MMTPAEIQEEVDCRVEGLIGELVSARLQELADDTDGALTSMLTSSHVIRKALYDFFEQRVANEIGNRLRCGVYDGTKIDRIFNSVWTEQLDEAIADRIQHRIHLAIDAAIRERLKTI